MAKLLTDYEAEIGTLVRDGASAVLFVTGATNATPIAVTTGTLHGRKTGDKVQISGVLGNTAANGFWAITVVDDDTFTLNTSVGNGAYTSGGVVYHSAGVLRVPKEIDSALERALEQYSKKVPRETVLDVASDGTGDFPLSSLVGFDEEFSGYPKIEWPIATTGKPSFLDRREWAYYRKPAPSGMVIRITGDFSGVPGVGAQVRFTYKSIHTVTSSASTVPDSDFFAVCKLAAAEMCEQLARHYNQSSERGILQGDQVNYQSKAKEYEDRGRLLRKQFSEHVGAGQSGPGAASVNKNWDLEREGVTHRRRDR